MPLRVASGPGAHRLPAPPAAAVRGRALVAAVAAGGIVAGGQTAAFSLHATTPPTPAATLLPVADTAQAAQGPVAEAIGNDLPTLDPLALGPLDATAALDVTNLAKAVDIGQELARQAAILDAALADGAVQAVVVDDSAYVRPTDGRLTSEYGPRWGTDHQGLDIAEEIGTPIYAFTDGVVEESGPASGFGMWVVLRHADGTRTVYGHINRTYVDIGQRVTAGEQIAEIGNRGRSTGPHLHFEVWASDGEKLDPAAWLQDRGIGL